MTAATPDPALHRQATEALANSPLPALLDSVQAIQTAMLASDPAGLRRSVGWLGRLLGRDIGLQAEAEAIATRLGVHLLDARRQLHEVEAYRARLQPLRRELLQAGASLAAEAESQAASGQATDDGRDPGQRAQHLLTVAGTYRITASHLELVTAQLDRLLERIGLMLPRVQLLLDQRRMLDDDGRRGQALASTDATLDALRGILRNNPPSATAEIAPATTRSTP